MILPFIALASFLQVPVIPLPKGSPSKVQPHDGSIWSYEDTGYPKVNAFQFIQPLAPPKISPLAFGQPPTHAEFNWMIQGVTKATADSPPQVRFRIFYQNYNPSDPRPMQATRELLRLWEFNYTRLKLDHNPNFAGGVVDVYLCDGGEPGGQQLFTADKQPGPLMVGHYDSSPQPYDATNKADAIYIYNLPSFNDTLEEAREVAHEYGHAVLPGIGGFKSPEYWANGYLGERLFLRWMRNAIVAKTRRIDDVFMTPLPRLDAWVKANVDPLEMASASRPPSASIYHHTTQTAMNAYIGLALYADSILPPHVFSRSMQLCLSDHAWSYPPAIVMAAEEQTYSPQFPNYLIGHRVWIPVGHGTVKGASALNRDAGWVQVVAKAHLVVSEPNAG